MGKVVDYEGTAPFKNRPERNITIPPEFPELQNHQYYGAPGFRAGPVALHACRLKPHLSQFY